MDSLTQGLLGGLTAQATAGKKRWRSALWIGFIAGIVADLDIFIRTSNPMSLVLYHRQFTHSLLFIPVAGAIITCVCLFFAPKLRKHWLLIFVMTCVAYTSHIVLDLGTSYGTELYWPFDKTRLAWNFIPIIDPVITFVLLIGYVSCLHKYSITRVFMPLLFVVMYLGFSYYQHHRALAFQQQLMQERMQHTVKGQVIPTIGQVYIWYSLYKHKGNIYFDVINLPYITRPYLSVSRQLPLFIVKDLPKNMRLQQNAMKIFKIFDWFSQGYLTKISTHPFIITNARFIRQVDPIRYVWGIQYQPHNKKYYWQWLRLSEIRKKR